MSTPLQIQTGFGTEDTLAELLLRRATETPDLLFALFPEETATLANLRDRAVVFAKGLIGLGLKPGDHVAILMPNCLDYMIAHFGVQIAGGVSVLLNARYRSHDLLYAVEHSDARFLITTAKFDDAVNYRETLDETYGELQTHDPAAPLRPKDAPKLEQIICFGGENWPQAIATNALDNRASDGELSQARDWQTLDSTAVLYYTSGTTSRPKACEISSAGLLRSWSIFTRTVDLKSGETVWDPMPFFHSGGVGLMAGILAAGARIASAPHFSPETALEMIGSYQIEHLYPGFHLLATPVIDSPLFSAAKFPFIRSLMVVGPLGATRHLQSLIPQHAVVLNLFGMSETSGLATLAARDDPEDVRLTTAGRALAGIEIRVCDPDSGAVLETGKRGEILIRGGGVFRGYYKNEAETQKALRADGFLRSGDLGTLQADGSLTYDGRIKDIIRIGGENVAAAEIESYLSTHKSVANVQVIGKPDARLDEVPVAFVELKAGHTVTEAELIAYCQGRIARFKIPTSIRFVTEWPMSATKIQKFKLKQLL